MHDAAHPKSELSDIEARVKALETILVEKGLVDPAAIDAIIETYAERVGPQNGATVVARAWCDADFAEALRTDATAAIASMGFEGRQAEHMEVLWNGSGVHNMVVCTLCSCYP